MKIINRTVLWVILSSIALAPGSLAQQQPNRPANPSIDPATQEQLASAQRAVDAQDYATALRIYHPLAERGVAAAQGGIARHYFNGWGVERNDAEALRWGRLGAAQNNALSFNVLGSAYANGRGVTQSDTEAVRWFRLAADQSFASAQFNLGLMYQFGRGVAKSDTEAVRWFRLAADQSFASAQNALGFMYENGRGVAKSDTEAVRLYRLAANQGNAFAQSNLGFMYENGRGVAKSDTEAVRWYKLAADQGNAAAQNNLGFMYENGRGVAKSDTEAVRLYRLAANQGNAAAQNNLGFMYENGRGVAKSDTEAVRLYRLAANQGNAAAQKKMQELEPRLRQQQEAAAYQERVLAYQKRDKTLLEQVLNYTATGNEDGNQFSRWISGDQGKHKCVMTLLHGAGLFDMLRGQLGELDIRQINKDGFRISTQYGNDGKPRIVAGDEKINVSSFVFLGSPPVMERLQKGWNLVFSECPSAVRRQF